jgi:hypothetical protein
MTSTLNSCGAVAPLNETRPDTGSQANHITYLTSSSALAM